MSVYVDDLNRLDLDGEAKRRRSVRPYLSMITDREARRTIVAIVDRDPCFKCGARGDVGCRHRRMK